MKKYVASALKRDIEKISQIMAENYFSESVVKKFGIQEKKNVEDMRVGFIVPLLRLLIEYFKNGKKEFLQIYIDERKRYSPHLAAKAVQLAYHEHMIKADYGVISSFLKNDFVSEYEWKIIHQSLIFYNEKTIKFLAVGDCLMNEVRVFSNPENIGKNFSLDFRCIYFSAGEGGSLDANKIANYINAHNIDIVSFSFFSFEALPEYSRIISHASKMTLEEIDRFCGDLIEQVESFLINLRAKTNITFLVHNASGLPLSRWRKWLPIIPALEKNKKIAVNKINTSLYKLINNTENLILIDEVTLTAKKGIKNCAKEIARQRKYGGMFHTSYFGMYLSEIYINEANFYLQMKKCKAILVDFDNTLWSGVMADGKVDHHLDRQRLLKELVDVGIILVAVSKNSEENIRWEEMLLKKEDFAFLQIHWYPKSESINTASKVLNLGKDSFVFIDDNRHERALVAEAHPEVVILDADADDSWLMLKRLKNYPNTQSTEEAKKRTAMYQEQAARNEALGGSTKSKENLKSLELWYQCDEAKTTDLDRLVELINRTNQFNLTTKRYSKSEVFDFITSESYLVISAVLGDKFGSLGLVAVIIVDLRESAHAKIDSFVMSCRAMGFSLEKALIYDLMNILKEKGVCIVEGIFIPTDRNSPAESLYSDVNFIKKDESHIYQADVNGYAGQSIDWLYRAKQKAR